MKWSNARIEARLRDAVKQRLASAKGSRGRMESNPRRFSWISLPSSLFFIAPLLAMILLSLGAFHREYEVPALQSVMLGWWCLVAASIIANQLWRESFDTPDVQTLWMLPVAGERILKWARARTIFKSLFFLILTLIMSWKVQDIKWIPSLDANWRWIAQGIVLWGITLATALADKLPLLKKSGVSRLWTGLRIGGGLLILLMMFSGRLKGVIHPSTIAGWADSASPVLVWLAPGSWVNHVMQGASAIPMIFMVTLTVTILTLGVFEWVHWPKNAAPAYDSDLPEYSTEEDDLEDEDEYERTIGVFFAPEPPVKDIAQAPVRIPSEKVREVLACPESTILLTKGWLESLFRWVLSKRDLAILPAFVYAPLNWTQAWKKAVPRMGILILLLTGISLLIESFPIFGKELLETIHQSVVIASILSGIIITFRFIPLAGEVSDVIYSQSAPHPQFCGFPVNAADFLRLSLKIVLVKLVACVALIMPLVFVIGWFYLRVNPSWIGGLWAIQWVTTILLFLVAIRPVAVAFHLGRSLSVTGSGKWRKNASLFFSLGLLGVIIWTILVYVIPFNSPAEFKKHGLTNFRMNLGALLSIFFSCWLIFLLTRWRIKGAGLDY